jgi:hypothetical protein
MKMRPTTSEHDAFPGITAEDDRLELSNALFEESRRSDDALADAEFEAQRQARADADAA